MDYSVFSENSGLFTSGLVSLSGQGVNIFPSFISPVLPDLANLTAYNSVPDSYSGIGDTLFFGNPAITNGNFTATKNIYIADYSSLSGLAISSVPVPAAFWFFISGLSILMGGKFRKQFF